MTGLYYGITIAIVSTATGMTVFTLNIHHKGTRGTEIPHYLKKICFDIIAKVLFIKIDLQELPALESVSIEMSTKWWNSRYFQRKDIDFCCRCLYTINNRCELKIVYTYISIYGLMQRCVNLILWLFVCVGWIALSWITQQMTIKWNVSQFIYGLMIRACLWSYRRSSTGTWSLCTVDILTIWFDVRTILDRVNWTDTQIIPDVGPGSCELREAGERIRIEVGRVCSLHPKILNNCRRHAAMRLGSVY